MKLHDVWVNWFEEENPHLVPHFIEWNNNDSVELLDTIPIIQVNANLYNYMVFGLNECASEFLDSVRNKAILIKGHEKIQLKYAFICTDGNDIMAIKLNDYGIVQKKSRLIMRQSQLVLDMIKDKIRKGNDYELNDSIDVSQYDRYIGLTRLEKDVLGKTNELVNRLQPEKLSLLKYIIAEWNLGLYKTINTYTFTEVKNRLLEEIKVSKVDKLVELNKIADKLKLAN